MRSLLNPSTRISTLPLTRSAASFAQRPSPPRLPKEQQEEYERLQAQSTGAFQTSNAATGDASELGEEQMHKDLRKGAKPEFEGDRNPKTGEVGGPKNEPLRWGERSEWTYNGRATDF